MNDATGSMNNYSFTAGYDDEDRLIDWDRTNGDTQDWTLSKVGDWSSFNENGTAVARTHNDVHELTGIGANSLTYDVKGNLLTDTDNHTYTWDFDNHLATAVVTSSSTRGTEGTHTYEYDALGRRVAKEVSDESGMTTVLTRTTYINNYSLLPPLSSVGGQVLAEYEKVDTGSTTLARTYTYGEYIDEPLSITDHSSTPVTYYYHTNRVFNVVGLTDDNDDVIELYTYTPYGTVDIRDPSNMATRTTSSYGNTYTFTGRRTDEETNLHYFRARYMDSVIGRFIGRDPIGYRDGSALYSATFMSGGTDPSGTSLTLPPYSPPGDFPRWPPWPGIPLPPLPDIPLPKFPDVRCLWKCPPEKRRSQSVCCKTAKQKGLIKYSAAGVVCCDGRKVSCVWSTGGVAGGNGTGNLNADAIIDSCFIVHEDIHHNHIRCKAPWCGTLSRPGFKIGMGQYRGECEAYRAQLDCMWSKFQDCRGAPACEAAVMDQIRHIYLRIRRFCG